MSSRMYGYARVSTKAQKEDRQLAALTQFGVGENDIVVEKQSGKDFDRPLYKGLLKRMQARDVLVVKSIDRLGRNYDEILEQWAYLTKEREISIVVLDMPLLDTREGRDLTGTLVADIVLQLLSYVAQTERDFMRQRQTEGIEAAKARGVRFGREQIPMPECFGKLAEKWWSGCISATVAGKQIGVSRDTFLRRAKEWGTEAGFAERGLPDAETGLEQIPQAQPETEACGFEESPVYPVNSSSETPEEGHAPQEQSRVMDDVKITYVNHSGSENPPAVFLLAKDRLPAFDAQGDSVVWRGSRAAVPLGGSILTGGSASINAVNDIQSCSGISVDLCKNGHVIMSKSVVGHGQKALLVLIPELRQDAASGLREGEPLSPAILDSASFYELEPDGLSEVTVGLYGSAQDGYELKVDFEK